MNRALARDLAITAVRASTQLSSLLPDLKEQCDPTEYARLLRSIASVCGHIVNEILTPLFNEHPDVEKELEVNIDRDGRV